MKRSFWIATIRVAGLIAVVPGNASAQYHSYPGMSQGISPYSASWHSLYGPGRYGYYGGWTTHTNRYYDPYDRYDSPPKYYRYDDYGRYDRNLNNRVRDNKRVYTW